MTHRIAFRVLTVALLCSLLAAGSGCFLAPTEEPEPTPTGTAAPPETITPEPTATPTLIPPGAPQTLTLWITELVAPIEENDRSRTFEQLLVAFEATHPGLTIEVLRKQPDGKGGLEDLVTGASAVAPAVVPDLLMIDMNRLPALAQEGLAVPLDELMPVELQEDMYPFAIQAGTVDGQLVGLPFEVSVEHALYNTAKIAVAPVSWTEVFSSGATYIFPTLGQDGLVNDAFLIQYVSTGAELLDSSGAPALDQQALTDVLTFYQNGIESGAVLSDVLEYDSVHSGWRKYLQAEVVMSNMTSSLYLEGRGLLKVSKATWVPTRDGQFAITLARGSAWAITTRDPNRLPLVTKLLTWLMSPRNMATWCTAAARLPTRRAAFEQMPRDDDEYVGFAYDQLEFAIPYASSQDHKRIYRAMQQGVDAVLRAGELPAVAAEGILRAVGQEVAP